MQVLYLIYGCECVLPGLGLFLPFKSSVVSLFCFVLFVFYSQLAFHFPQKLVCLSIDSFFLKELTFVFIGLYCTFVHFLLISDLVFNLSFDLL